MSDPGQFESQVLAFERAWQGGSPREIKEFLHPFEEDDRSRLLTELVCVDLEYRWRNPAAEQTSPKWTLSDYVDAIGELRSLDGLPLEAIEEEYRVRCRWRDHPSHESFVARFKRRQVEILWRLCHVDRELRDESDHVGTAQWKLDDAVRPAQRQTTEFDPRAPLRFNDYLLQEMIGAGRTGKVYRAWQRSLERPVAVKYLRESFQTDPEAVERFVNEAKTVSQF